MAAKVNSPAPPNRLAEFLFRTCARLETLPESAPLMKPQAQDQRDAQDHHARTEQIERMSSAESNSKTKPRDGHEGSQPHDFHDGLLAKINRARPLCENPFGPQPVQRVFDIRPGPCQNNKPRLLWPGRREALLKTCLPEKTYTRW